MPACAPFVLEYFRPAPAPGLACRVRGLASTVAVHAFYGVKVAAVRGVGLAIDHPRLAASAVGLAAVGGLVGPYLRRFFQRRRAAKELSGSVVTESYRAGSEYYTLDLPSYAFRVYYKNNTTSPQTLEPVCVGLRWDRYLIIPQHAVAQYPEVENLVLMSSDGQTYPGPTEWQETGYDIVFAERPPHTLPSTKGITVGLLSHPTAVNVVGVHTSDNASSGILKHSRTFGAVVYEGSTRFGFSGAAYAVGTRVYGIHTCGGGVNFGLSMEYVCSLIRLAAQTRPESSEGEALRRMLRQHGGHYEDLEFGATAHGLRQVRYLDRYFDIDLNEAEELANQYAQEEDEQDAQFEERLARMPVRRARTERRRFSRRIGESIAPAISGVAIPQVAGNSKGGARTPPTSPAPQKSGAPLSVSGTRPVIFTTPTPSLQQRNSPMASSLIFGDEGLPTLMETFRKLRPALPPTVSGASNRTAASSPQQKLKETMPGPAMSTATLSDVLSSLHKIETLLTRLLTTMSSSSTSMARQASARSGITPPSVMPWVGKGKQKPLATKTTTASSGKQSAPASRPSTSKEVPKKERTPEQAESRRRRARRRRQKLRQQRKESGPATADQTQ